MAPKWPPKWPPRRRPRFSRLEVPKSLTVQHFSRFLKTWLSWNGKRVQMESCKHCNSDGELQALQANQEKEDCCKNCEMSESRHSVKTRAGASKAGSVSTQRALALFLLWMSFISSFRSLFLSPHASLARCARSPRRLEMGRIF